MASLTLFVRSVVLFQQVGPAQRCLSTLVYDAGDIHAVWKVGDSFLKVIIPDSQETTCEHVTLNGIRHLLSGTEVDIPDVL